MRDFLSLPSFLSYLLLRLSITCATSSFGYQHRNNGTYLIHRNVCLATGREGNEGEVHNSSVHFISSMRVGSFRESHIHRVGLVGSVVYREAWSFHHGQNLPPFGVGKCQCASLGKLILIITWGFVRGQLVAQT